MNSKTDCFILIYMKLNIFFASCFILYSSINLTAQINLSGKQTIPDPEIEIVSDEINLKPGESGIISVLYHFPEGYHQTKEDSIFRLDAESGSGIIFGSTLYPEGVVEKGVESFYEEALLRLEYFVPDTIEEGAYEISVTARFQLCDEDGICYFPGSETLSSMLSIRGKPVGSASVIYYLLLAFLGGILLNLMPCVLPLLSVKAMNLINQSQGDKKSILINALTYSLGIIFSFWAMSLFIVILQQSGNLLGWGFQFQNPYFLIVLISVIFIFALSLFEVFILLPPSSGLNKASGLSEKKGYAGSFFTGVFAVFVATPCTAPFLGAAMGFAFSQPPLIIIAIMTVTGLGLSLPFLILGFIPGFFKHMPKPGKWMDTFREAMAFLMVGTAVYLSSTLIKQIGLGFIPFLWFLLILSFIAWLWGWSSRNIRKKNGKRLIWFTTLSGIALSSFFFLSPSVILGENSTGYSQSLKGNWIEFSPQKMNELISGDKTVFLAFSASWCTTCKINEKNVLYTEEADRFFEEKDVVLVRGDLTSTNQPALEWIYSFDRAGVPLYILYKPGEDPRILPELLSQSIIESYWSE